MPSTARPLLAAATAAGLVWWWLRRRADRALEVTSKPDWVSTLIHGDVSPGFEAVRDEFIENFRRRGEVGAAVCIFYRGKKVVDLWGGYRDRRSQAPWERDTLVNVFSTTKGIASLATALQHSRGLLELDAPVSRYWEDFSANGKEKVTVRQLISHMVGLAAIDEPITVEMLEDVVRTYRCIARQRMEWAEPGEHHGYMAQTLGWYESALVHYTDPSRRSIGRFIADEICAPLGCANELYVGLPSTVPDDRLATLEVFSLFQTLLHLDSMPRKFVERLLFHPKSYTARSFLNPKELGNLENYNSRRMRALEMPAANGHATARALASCYSAVERAISRNEMVARGSVAGSSNVLGLRAATLEALQAPAVKATKGGWHDEVLQTDTAMSMGYLKPNDFSPFGSDERAFGTPGAGGNNAFVDPSSGLAFAYVENRMGFFIVDDPREYALRARMYECVVKLRAAEGLPDTISAAPSGWTRSCLQPGSVTEKWLERHPGMGLQGG